MKLTKSKTAQRPLQKTAGRLLAPWARGWSLTRSINSVTGFKFVDVTVSDSVRPANQRGNAYVMSRIRAAAGAGRARHSAR